MPGATSEPGGIVAVAEQGKELLLSGLGRNYSTSGCWEGIANGRTINHSASERAWRSVCESAAGDPRRSAVTTSLTATDERIDFVETGQFEFVIGGDTCHVVMRRSRTYTLVEREGETRSVPVALPTAPTTEPGAASTPPARPNAPTRDKASCTSPGPASRIEVSPSRKLLRAGDTYSFRIRVLDASGCPLDQPVTWKSTAPTSLLEVSPNGVIRVPAEAPEGTAELSASIQDRSVTVWLDVVSAARYKELLRAGSFDAAGENQDRAVVTLVSSTLGTRAAAVDNSAERRRLYFIGTIGAIAALLAGAALWMGLSRRRPPKDALRREDLAPLAHSNGASKPASQTPLGSGRRICPLCGAIYETDGQFCGNDGAALVQIN